MSSSTAAKRQSAPLAATEQLQPRRPALQLLEGGGDTFDWGSDVWSLSDISRVYSLRLSATKEGATVGFAKLGNEAFRALLKGYLRLRLLTHTLALGSLSGHRSTLAFFLSVVDELHPGWTGLSGLSREDAEEYLLRLSEKGLKASSHNNEIGSVRVMLADLQALEDPAAPMKPAFAIIRDEDYKRVAPKGGVDHIPRDVMEQIIPCLDQLGEFEAMAFLTCYKTGIRVGDVLSLTPDNIVKIGGRAYIRHHIQKSDVEDHLVPIDGELEEMLDRRVREKASHPTGEGSPYLFFERKGPRRGKAIAEGTFNNRIRRLIEANGIEDANGEPFHAHAHQLRHTFGIEMRRGGMDARTLQELYGHADIGVTLKYSKSLGEDKRAAFELAKESGCFEMGAAREAAAEIAGAGLEVALMAGADVVEVPYGLCTAPPDERCAQALQPPCICGGRGSVCRDLVAGALEADVEKYVVQIRASAKLAEIARACGREDMAEASSEKVRIMRRILEEISAGRVVAGDAERLRRRLEGNGSK